MAHVKRNSYIYPIPTVDARQLPQNWQPTGGVVGDWGTLKILFNGSDVTNWRGVPCQPLSWDIGEPFGYKTASIRFPQIMPWEALPAWLEKFVDVQIVLVRPDASEKVLWRGMFVSEEDQFEEVTGFTAHCMGSLYQADFYLKKPRLGPPVMEDLWTIISRELNPDDPGAEWPNRSGARWGIPVGALTGMQFQQQGSWEPLLTGYISDLLGRAGTLSGDQWTLDITSALVPTLKLKDRTTINWNVRAGQPGVRHSLTKDYTMSPNCLYGDGINLNHCHWRNTRYPPPGVDPATYPDPPPPPGYTVADVDRSPPLPVSVPIFQPVIEADPTTRWWRTVAEGAIIGRHPGWDMDIVRIEHYQNFGSYISPEEARDSAAAEYNRRLPAYVGTITLALDPQEGSRFEIAAGQNIRLLGYRGTDPLLHISDVDINWDSQTVTLQVDERARDFVTVAAVINRERQNNDPSLRPQRTFRNSRAIEDRQSAVWDCESGAGDIPVTAVTALTWTTIQIPGGSVGNVINTRVTTSPATPFALGVWDRPPPALSGVPGTDDWWDQFDETTGLIIAWGAGTDFAGYSPGTQSGGDPLTGVLTDNASWYYQSEQPPWLWVTVLTGSDTSLDGLFRPGANYG